MTTDDPRDSEGRSAEEAATEFFEFEYCDACGLDAKDHTPIFILGNWFFRCDKPSKET